MPNEMDFIVANGASLTVDVSDICYSGEEAKKHVKKLIKRMELEEKDVILSNSGFRSRITIRIKGDSKKIENFLNTILKDNRFCVIKKISLAF